MAFIGKNPKFNSGTYTPQSADPSTPSEGMVFYADGTSRAEGLWQYKNGAWIQVGAATSGGINYIENPDAEGGTTGWATYADAAGSDPVDGTGGSANITLSRTTTTSEVLRGIASFEIAKDAANRQGEGASYDFSIDRQDRGKLLEITFDYAASANFVSGQSSDIRVFIYDVTNGDLITPLDNRILTAGGRQYCTFNAAGDSTSYRLIFHIATTNASAYDFFFDNVRVGPKEDVQGLVGTDYIDYSNDVSFPSGWGIVTEVEYWGRRIGDSLQVRAKWKVGSPTANPVQIPLPNSLAINTSKFTLNSTATLDNLHMLGQGSIIGTATGTAYDFGLVFYASDSGVIKFDNRQNNLESRESNVNGIFNSGDIMMLEMTVPIQGWTAEVSLANSAVFRISNVIANGTRVTSDPTQLGEYRSQLRSSGTTYTDTNGDPTDAPSASNGIRIYEGNAYGSADTNNQPTRYKIFVGKNKYIKMEWYASSGRSGFASAQPTLYSSTETSGYFHSYNPSTGILEVVANRTLAGTSTHTSAVDQDGVTALTDIYFDVIVSENAQAVGAERPRSSVTVHTGNGFGGTNANRRFSTILEELGSAITYADDANDGASFTINEDGIYAIDWTDLASGGNFEAFISVNQVAPVSVTVSERLVNGFIPNGERDEVNAISILRKGDIIRLAGSNTSLASSNDVTKCRITKISD